MALPQEKIESFRRELFARREALASGLRQATADLISDDTVYNDSLDQASADTEKSLSVHMKNRDRDILLQIDEALKRISEGSYQFCERCEEPISEARLKAFPFTTFCIDCKAELESEEHRFTHRLS